MGIFNSYLQNKIKLPASGIKRRPSVLNLNISEPISVLAKGRKFVTLINLGYCAIQEGILKSQKDFLEKVGSNFILQERRLIFSTEGTFRPFLLKAPYQDWRRDRDSNPGYPKGKRALQARALGRYAISPN